MQNPKAQKKIDILTVFFASSGSARVKAAHMMLMKLTPGRSKIEAILSIFGMILKRKK